MAHPITDLLEEIGDRIDEIAENIDWANADEIGLDIRAGRVKVSPEGILVPEPRVRTLEYYGGFEYVDRNNVYKLGKYTFYSRGDQRVAEAIEYYMDNKVEEEE